MKKLVKTGFTALLAAMTVLALIGCPQPEAVSLSGAAVLSSFAIGEAAVETIPVPITQEQWEDTSFNIATAASASIEVDAAAIAAGIKQTASGGAEVLFAMTALGSTIRPTPSDWVSEITVQAEKDLYVRVISENKAARNYYRFVINPHPTIAKGAVISAFAIGNSASDRIPAPATAAQWSNAEFAVTAMDSGSIAVTIADMAAGVVQTASVASTVSFAMTDLAAADKPDTWTSAVTVEAGKQLYVRVVSGDQSTTNYYRFAITRRDPSTGALLTALSIGEAAPEALPTVISKAQWDDPAFVIEGEYSAAIQVTTADIAAGLTQTASERATVSFAQIASAVTARPIDWSSEITVRAPQQLYVRVVSEDTLTTNYYHFVVGRFQNLTGLSRVTIGGVRVEAAMLGTPNANYAQAVAGLAMLSAAQATNAEVSVVKPETATVKFAKAAGTDAPVFGDVAQFTFADGDFLYIEVTAQDLITKNIYKIEIGTGRSTNLTSVTIGSARVSTLGTPGTAETVRAGTFLTRDVQPQDGYTITVVKEENAQTVKYAKAAGDAVPAAFSDNNKIVFMDGEFLWLEVTAINGRTKGYYKIAVNLRKAVTIDFGTPEIRTDADKYIDPIWNDVTETLEVNNVYRPDSGDYPAPPATHATAKLFFDNDALYAYVDVTDPSISESDNAHNTDSIEFFINEDFDGHISGNYSGVGGQHRIGANGTVSGDAVTARSVWKKDDNTGYVAIFKINWRYKGAYPLEDGKKVGIDVQLNVAEATGSRHAVVVWSNIWSGNYQNLSNFGMATLNGGGSIVFDAKDPTITKHPASAGYDLNETVAALTVEATASDSETGGVLSYQWYSATGAGADGTLIDGATSASYAPAIDTAAPGTYWYYAVVTNTNNSANGVQVKTVTSGRARIMVADLASLVERVVTGGKNVPVYKFTLPEGKTWADMGTKPKVRMTILQNAENFARDAGNQRNFVFGEISKFPRNQNWNAGTLSVSPGPNGFDAYLPYMLNQKAGDYAEGSAADTWFTVEYSLNDANKGPGYTGAYWPANDVAGDVYFGIGITTQDTQQGEYHVKEMSLVSEDGAVVVPCNLHGDGRIDSANWNTGYIRVNNNVQGVTPVRELVVDPTL